MFPSVWNDLKIVLCFVVFVVIEMCCMPVPVLYLCMSSLIARWLLPQSIWCCWQKRPYMARSIILCFFYSRRHKCSKWQRILYCPFLALCLNLIEFAIRSRFLHQLIVRTALCNMAVFQNDNLIGDYNRAESVSNNKNRLSSNQPGDGLLNQHFIFWVKACCCFVKQNNRCIL